MIDAIATHLQQKLNSNKSTEILINNTQFGFNNENYKTLPVTNTATSLAFIDGGQAEILRCASFCVSLIRVNAILFDGLKKKGELKHEFFLITTPVYQQGSFTYENEIFPLTGKSLLTKDQLFFKANDPSLRNGNTQAPIEKITGVVRRFAELALAATVKSADYIIIDGTLEPTYTGEERYLEKLPPNTLAVAKSSSLLTTSSLNPAIFLNQQGPPGTWIYKVNAQTSFAKLHKKSKHIFRTEGNTDALLALLPHCNDAVFLGYPYGLIVADKLARISNQEKKSLMIQFLLHPCCKELLPHLQTSNAHDILDSMG